MPPRLRRHIVSATEQAGQRGDEAATTEDLLHFIARDEESAAAFVLQYAKISPGSFAERLTFPAATGQPSRQRAQRLDSELISLLQRASTNADRLGHAHIGTEHVLLATIESSTLSGKLLTSMGATLAVVESGIKRWVDDDMLKLRGEVPTASAAGVMKVPGFLRKLMKSPAAMWNILIRKSLAHPRFVSDPYPLYRWLRKRDPVRKDPLAPVWGFDPIRRHRLGIERSTI